MRFIISTQLPLGMLAVARASVEKAGHDGWIPVIMTGLLVVMSQFLIIKLCSRFGGESVLEIVGSLFGKYLGFIFKLVLIGYVAFATAVNIRYFTLVVSVWFFSSTPLWILTVLLISTSVYLVFKGLKGICRFDSIIFLIILITIFLLGYGFLKIKPTLLMPVGSCGLGGAIAGIPSCAFSYMGFEMLLFIFPYIKDKQNAKKFILWGEGITIAVYTAIALVAVGIFGENYIMERQLILTSLAKLIRFPVFERIDLYFYALWIPGMILCVTSYLFCSFNSIKKTFRVKSSLPLLAVLVLALLIASGYTEDVNAMMKISHLAGFMSYGVGIVLPVLLLLLAWILKKGGKKKHGKTL